MGRGALGGRSLTLGSPRRLGIMGGTFDPIHLGHLAVAEEARERLGLELVLFVPAGTPPHKPEGTAASVADRVAMVELAIEGNDAFELSRIEVDRAGPSYTSDTVALLARGGAELVLILSAETFHDLPTWHEPERLLDAAHVAVVPREGFPAPDAGWTAAQFPGREDRITVLDGPRLGISSTGIRARIADARSIRYLVPEAVRGYIEDHGLYTRRTPST
jgi:nicotinate-nucleotide adenylyltransferase